MKPNSRTELRHIISSLLLIAATGCYTKRTQVQEPVTGEVGPVLLRQNSAHVMTHEMQSRPVKMLPEQGAEEFLRRRLKESGLPGLPRNVPGTFESTLKMESAAESAPAPCAVRFFRTGDPNPYVYFLEPTQDTPAWRIARAFQADPNGRILKEFTVE